MADAALLWGGDLAAGPTGDIAVQAGTGLGQQRVLRRLLTNPGAYVWHPDYGAGLAQFIGTPVDPAAIRSVVRSEIFKESTVARTPEPIVQVSEEGGDIVLVSIQYVDSSDGTTQILSFSVSV